MKSNILGVLLGLNLVLALALFSRPVASPALAQGVRTGDYLMLPGEVVGGNNAIVYIVDTSTGMLSAVTYDDGQRRLVPMGTPVELGRVFDQFGPNRGKR